MYLRRALKSNKGSSLIIVIMIIIFMSLLGVTVMAVTMSDLQMSSLYGDVNRAYHVAEAGAEQVARVLDDEVAAIQESARKEADEYIETRLSDSDVKNGDGSLMEDVIKSEYDTKYIESFCTGVVEKFSNVSELDEMKLLLDTDTTTDDGLYPIKDIEPDGGRIVLEWAQPEEILDESGGLEAYHVKIGVEGIYDNYKKKLNVTFNLLPEPKEVAYRPVIKFIVNKAPNKPKIFEKALVAEKNIIAVDGTANITGNVLCFGTIPTSNGEEDQTAPWYRYGGIMAGMCSDVYNNSAQFGFDPSKVGNHKVGSINILNGDAATFAYIHTLYGTQNTHSDIKVEGKTFARSVRTEENSNYSLVDLNHVYTTDNLQLDSNRASITVGGNYYGFVDAGYAIQGGVDTSSKDAYEHKRTSSVVVNGDSTLNLNGEVYIGGSTFFKTLVDSLEHPYMTGISALKSSKRVGNAFMKDDNSNPDNNLYWYDGDYQPTSTTARYSQYGDQDMMVGRSDDLNDIPFFPIQYRAVHFRAVWENLWKDDNVFSKYINADNIRINTTDGKLNGYSNGAIVANGVVYDPYRDFNQLHDETGFHTNIQQPSIKAFYDSVSDLLAEAYSAVAPKLDYVAPTKHIDSYMDASYATENKIVPNEVYLVPEKGIVYYGSGDKEIYFNGFRWCIGSEMLSLTRGIIFIDGNVYINNGFSFNGTIMATGNIVFLGNANITYDGAVIDDLINSDVNVSGLLRMNNTYEIPSGSQQSQRVQQKNIDVVEWKEIPLN